MVTGKAVETYDRAIGTVLIPELAKYGVGVG